MNFLFHINTRSLLQLFWFTKNCVLLLVLFGLLSCSRNADHATADLKDTSILGLDTAKHSTAAEFSYTGTFEFSTPDEDGYLYYKIQMMQHGDSVQGKLFAANYLSSSAGEYTNPNALMECDLIGYADESDGEHFITAMLTITRNELLEEGAPSLYDKMNFPDSEEEVNVTFWTLWMDNGVLASNNGQRTEEGERKMLVWRKK